MQLFESVLHCIGRTPLVPLARFDALVCGVGTGGTLTGAGRFLKERKPAVRCLLADPEGSTLSGGAVVAALRWGMRPENAGKLVAVVLPDTGRNYLSKIHSDDWMREKGL